MDVYVKGSASALKINLWVGENGIIKYRFDSVYPQVSFFFFFSVWGKNENTNLYTQQNFLNLLN